MPEGAVNGSEEDGLPEEVNSDSDTIKSDGDDNDEDEEPECPRAANVLRMPKDSLPQANGE